jgi:hypothetical protein
MAYCPAGKVVDVSVLPAAEQQQQQQRRQQQQQQQEEQKSECCQLRTAVESSKQIAVTRGMLSQDSTCPKPACVYLITC